MDVETRDQEIADSKTGDRSDIGRFLVFLLIQLVLSPLSLIGFIGFLVKLKLKNQPQGISGTAYEPHWARVMAHRTGARPDDSAYRLAQHLPASSSWITTCVADPTAIAAQASGYQPKMLAGTDERPAPLMTVVAERNEFFDAVLEDAQDHVRQVVFLGSGWDTRAYEALRGWPYKIFEVDMPATLSAKVDALDAAGINRSHVEFVETDFDQTTWLEALQAQGFDPSLPTYVHWEGVTMYLTDDAIKKTLAEFATLAPGSRIAFDYFSREFVDGEAPYKLISAYAKFGIKLTYNEHWVSGIPMRPVARDGVAELVSQFSLSIARFDMVGTDGKNTAVYAFAEARNAPPD